MKNDYARYFNSPKPIDIRYGEPKNPKREGRIVWESGRLGTYIKAKHGQLK